jgi:hypothetical protein
MITILAVGLPTGVGVIEQPRSQTNKVVETQKGMSRQTHFFATSYFFPHNNRTLTALRKWPTTQIISRVFTSETLAISTD